MKFFNTIRRKLLYDGKITRYLSYAVGEIILVVIGILIALQINNWNNEKNSRAFELKMLNEIDKALTQDHRFFTDHLINIRNKAEFRAIAFFDRAITTKNINKDSIDYHFNRLDHRLRVTTNRGPYDALKSSGLDKISNDSLRNQLIYFYDFILPRYQGLIQSKLDESSDKMAPLIEMLSKPSPVVITDKGIIRSDLSLKEIDFEKNEEFNRLLFLTTERAALVKEVLEATTPYMSDLSKLINEEIEK